MAFLIAGFSPVGAQARSGVVPSIYSYTTADSLATAKAAGYFNDLRDQIYKDDVIILITDSGTTAVLTLVFVLLAPRSPLTTDVTIVTVDISAA